MSDNDGPGNPHRFNDDDDNDDNDPPPGSAAAAAAAASRRGTRACDRCRKIKSKCEPTEGDRCKNCLATGSPCTYQGPSFKRGPPKGYIHAIEQRWHQVECILATVMASQRSRDVIAEMRQDPLARSILDRVESGPYGSVGRSQPAAQRTQDGLYDTIMTQSTQGVPHEDRRSKRQSRMTRELVSNQDPTMAVLPTAEWQEQLFQRLVRQRPSDSPIAPYSGVSGDFSRYVPSTSTRGSSMSGESSLPGAPARRRRKVEASGEVYEQQHYQNSSEEPPEPEEYDEAADSFGHLSVDENQAIRYHGRSAGLHLLAKSDRTDDHQQLKENGIWKFKAPRIDAECQCLSFEQVNDRIQLPDIATQDHLITLYFTYVHHYFPIVHKASFLALYYERHLDEPTDHRSREPMQAVTKMLLLAMFSHAARYSQDANTQTAQEMLEAGHEYAVDARRLLNTLYEDSRPSTCQALLLLGIREFGLGSVAQGWLYIGMGCRMAIDLGMNRDAGQWKDSQGNDLFTPVDTQIRRQIWWTCCISDKLSSTWLGRPVMFRKGDFDTPEPDPDLNEDQEVWRPYPRNVLGDGFVPMPGHVMTCVRAQCHLASIMSDIMLKIYPVKWCNDAPKRTILETLETALQQWMINLPDPLRFHEGNIRPAPPPHVLVLHIEYYSALLLLNRAFLPSRQDGDQRDYASEDSVQAKCFNVSQGAAVRISSLVNKFHNVFDVKRGPPFLIIFIQSAGIMHIVTLNRQPGDVQASLGLMQCIHAAEAMENVWPAATRVKNLLQGAKVQLANVASLNEAPDRSKRRAEEALEDVPAYMMPTFDTYGQSYHQAAPIAGPSSSVPAYTQGSESYAMAYPAPSPHSASMTYVPGYEWWPQLIGPGMGQGMTPDFQSPAAHQQGLPHGLYSFNPEHMPEYSSGAEHLDTDMSHSSHYHHSQHPRGAYRK